MNGYPPGDVISSNHSKRWTEVLAGAVNIISFQMMVISRFIEVKD
jgi:hypothetical protein